MTTNTNDSGYYGRGIPTPLLDGDMPEASAVMAAEFTDEELEVRYGEDAEAYVRRLSALALHREVAAAPVRGSLTAAADGRWVEQRARALLADRGIERPSLAEYRGALADAYALLVKSRTS